MISSHFIFLVYIQTGKQYLVAYFITYYLYVDLNVIVTIIQLMDSSQQPANPGYSYRFNNNIHWIKELLENKVHF